MNLEWVPTAVTWTAWLARAARAKGIVSALRERAMIGLLRPLHLDLIHRMRQLAIAMDDCWVGEADVATEYAVSICTYSRKLLGTFLELGDHDLHCCLKVMSGDDRVGTWARSTPLDTRPADCGDMDGHLVGENTVWSALLGRHDPTRQWNLFNCFACNDLTKHVDEFHCSRANWGKYYRSTLVFPLRYKVNRQAAPFRHLGFLAFDSLKTGIFRGLPDIFDYQQKQPEYDNLLEARAVFHLGAICADVLSTFLRNAYETHQTKVEEEGHDDQARRPEGLPHLDVPRLTSEGGESD